MVTKEFLRLPLTKIIPYENNPRINDEAVKDVMESVKQCGELDPIEIDENNVILSGHTRLKAYFKLGFDEADVVRFTGLDEEQKRKYRLLANKTGEKAQWDFDKLAVELIGLNFDGYDFGFDVPIETASELVDTVVPDAPEEAKTKLGDVYQLGDNKLICGDSTKRGTFEYLLGGEKAEILFTSPPYSDIREYNGNKDLSIDNLSEFITATKDYTDFMCVNLGIQRKNEEIIPYWEGYIQKAKENGLKLLAWNVWDKMKCGSVGQQKAFIPIRHEWIFVFGEKGKDLHLTWEKRKSSIYANGRKRKVRQADGSMKVSTCGVSDRAFKKMESLVKIPEKESLDSVTEQISEIGKIRSKHPATFPVYLPAEYIIAMTNEGDAVIEPFGGSGTTLIACEQLKRKCYCVELDPHYCDVIIERWENLTGKKAVKLK